VLLQDDGRVFLPSSSVVPAAAQSAGTRSSPVGGWCWSRSRWGSPAAGSGVPALLPSARPVGCSGCRHRLDERDHPGGGFVVGLAGGDARSGRTSRAAPAWPGHRG